MNSYRGPFGPMSAGGDSLTPMSQVPGHIRSAGEAVESALALAHEAGEQSSVRLLSAVLGLLRAVEFGGAPKSATKNQCGGVTQIDGLDDAPDFVLPPGFTPHS